MYCLTNKKSGFSLIELLVVISLFTITSIAVTVSYVSFANKEQVKNGALLLKSDLRSAQSKAISGDKTSNSGDCPTLTSGSGSIVSANTLAGWYLDITPGAATTSYTLSGDCFSDSTTFGESAFSAKTVNLPQGVFITAVKKDLVPVATRAYIFFKVLDNSVAFYDAGLTAAPPPPDFFDGAGLKKNELGANEIVVTVTDNTNTYEVHVEKGGNIYEKQCPCT